jgi:RimJ/RimL family protein N-acetyltransferase
MGIGKEMVKQFCSSIPDKVRAEVKKENISSSKIAEYAGMELEDEKPEVLFYFRN